MKNKSLNKLGKATEILGYITTYSFILIVLSVVTLSTFGLGIIVGLVIFRYFKKLGSYNYSLFSKFKELLEKEISSEQFSIYWGKSENWTIIQSSILVLLFIMLIFIDGAFTDGLVAVCFLLSLIIFNGIHFIFLNETKQKVLSVHKNHNSQKINKTFTARKTSFNKHKTIGKVISVIWQFLTFCMMAILLLISSADVGVITLVMISIIFTIFFIDITIYTVYKKHMEFIEHKISIETYNFKWFLSFNISLIIGIITLIISINSIYHLSYITLLKYERKDFELIFIISTALFVLIIPQYVMLYRTYYYFISLKSIKKIINSKT